MKINLREFWITGAVVGLLTIVDAAFLAVVGPSWFFLHNPFYLAGFAWAGINLSLIQTFWKARIPLHSSVASLLFTALGFPIAVQSGVFLVGDLSYGEVSAAYLAFMGFTGLCTIYLNLRLASDHAPRPLFVEVDGATGRTTGIDPLDWTYRWFLSGTLALLFVPLSTIRNLSGEEMPLIEGLLLMRYRVAGFLIPLALVTLGGMLRRGFPCLLGAALRLTLLGGTVGQLQRAIPSKPITSLIGEGMILEAVAMTGMAVTALAMMLRRPLQVENSVAELATIQGANPETGQEIPPETSQGETQGTGLGTADTASVGESPAPNAAAFSLSRIEYGMACLCGLLILLLVTRHQDPWEAARDAIQRKDLCRLTAVLDRHPDLLSKVHPFFKTNLFYTAARDGSSEILRHLADRGIDMNLRDDSGFPPTYWMIEPRRLDDLRYLAEKGADFTPDIFIHCAIKGIHRRTDFSVLDFLFELRRRKGIGIEGYGTKPDSSTSQYLRDEQTRNPVAVAAAIGNPTMCEYLRGKGFPVDNDVVAGAISSTEFEALLPFLRTHARITDDTGTKRPLVFDAVRLRRSEWFTELVERGMNPRAVDVEGNNALHTLAEYPISQEAVVVGLASHEIDINAANKAGKTPLWLSIEYGQPFNLGLFLRMGADPRKPGPGGRMPLDFAGVENNPNLVKMLERALKGSSER